MKHTSQIQNITYTLCIRYHKRALHQRHVWSTCRICKESITCHFQALFFINKITWNLWLLGDILYANCFANKGAENWNLRNDCNINFLLWNNSNLTVLLQRILPNKPQKRSLQWQNNSLFSSWIYPADSGVILKISRVAFAGLVNSEPALPETII
jgi:hypothetical protein